MSDLKVIVPSRGRPAGMRRLRHAWTDTDAEAELLFCLDDDDPKLHLYTLVARESGVVIGPRLGLAGTLNLHALQAAETYRHVGFCGDDHLPRTHGWDRLVSEALDELGTGIVYGNDLFQYGALPTAVFVTADIVRTLGYLVPPPIEHLYADNVWLNWGLAVDRIRYLPDVTIEHLHPAAGKADSDEGYDRVNSADQYAKDGDAYRAYMADRFPADVAKLQALL